MTIDEAIEIMGTEKACVKRNIKHECNKDCFQCDLLKEDSDILKGYDMAIEALEKQIPKKMEQKAHPDFPHMGKFWHCTCGVYYLESGGNYCGNCGQRLEWGKEEC